jgi:serine protease
MHIRPGILAVLGLSLPALAQQDLPAQAHARARAALEANPNLVHSPSALLVKFKGAAAAAQRAAARAAAGSAVVREYQIVPGLELVETSLPVEHARAAFLASAAVEYAEPDRVVRTTATPNDPYFSSQWGAQNAGQSVNGDPGTAGADGRAAGAWSVSTGNPSFIIAMIDTGVDHSHPDLAPNIWTNPGEVVNGWDDDGNGYIDDVRGWDFYEHDGDPGDADGHGTHTAGIAGAVGNNGIGVSGVMWSCRIMPLRFIGPNGGYLSDAVLALQYAVSKGAKVSSNSWGVAGSSMQSMYDAIAAARSSGHIFVAAAGNGGADYVGDNNDTTPFYPASYGLDNIISVTASDNDDGRPGLANFGPTSVDLAAPGVNIISTYPGGNYGYNTGTSMSAPFVAGVVGLVYASNPGWTYQQVRQRVLSTARPVPSMAGVTVTGGVVNAEAAMAAQTTTPPPPSAAGPVAPGTPTVVRLSGGQVRVSWEDNSANEDRFEVQRERKASNTWTGSQVVAAVGANVTSATDAPGTGTFRYRVRAGNAAGWSAWSGWKQVKN